MAKLIVDFEIKGQAIISTDNNPTDEEMQRLIDVAYKNVDRDILNEADFDNEKLWIEEAYWSW
ncbi:aminoglycoside phosphotransferase [Staphylococcus caledonicus]